MSNSNEDPALRELEDELRAYPTPIPEPTDAEARRLRGSVLELLEREGRLRLTRPATPGALLRLAATVLLASALGFLLGTVHGEGRPTGDPTPRLLELLERQARGEPTDAPAMLVSRVELDPAPGGVAVSFELGSRAELVLDPDAPLLGELLRQALLGEADTPARLEAVERLAGRAAYTETLVAALRTDPDEQVRTEALRVLLSHESHGMSAELLEERIEHDPSKALRWAAFEARYGAARTTDALLRQALLGREPGPGYPAEATHPTYHPGERP
ncbi:MAG: HEAT repeat domain-containing protein [Holophagales bacterium]|nr:HEAT repeat domain-containing protein [Holophagales bacterium]